MSLDATLSLFNFKLSLGAISIPIIAASIGWFTNYIAIKMLFHPRNKVKFLCITFHGVFPKRQLQLAEKLGELFAEKLGVQRQIEANIVSLVNLEDLKDKLISKVSEAAVEYLNTEMPFLVPMLPNDLLKSLSEKIGTKIFTQIESQMKTSIETLGERVDIKKIVQTEINSLKPADLEVLLQALLQKEFKFIELSGAILGFFIGCIQLALTPFI